ncbi:MAG TPA: hypothetical protein VMK83_11970 [Gaiellaceae bacterium]|nr:hypothetical protein [Gaiellaceae bacterium]
MNFAIEILSAAVLEIGLPLPGFVLLAGYSESPGRDVLQELLARERRGADRAAASSRRVTG